jgi:hypothetical protein
LVASNIVAVAVAVPVPVAVARVIVTVIAAVVDRMATVVGPTMDADPATTCQGDGRSGGDLMKWHRLGTYNTDNTDADDEEKTLIHLLILNSL